MTSPEPELVDNVAYEAIEAQVVNNGEDIIEMAENAYYNNPELVCKESDEKYSPASSSQKGVVALAIVTVVLSLGLIAACIAFAVQIAALRSEITLYSDRYAAGTEMPSSIQIAALQMTLSSVSDRLDNISNYLMMNSETTSNQVTLLQNNISMISDRLDNVANSVKNNGAISSQVTSLQQNLSMVSDRVDNVANSVINNGAISSQVTSLQQNLSMVSDRLDNVANSVINNGAISSQVTSLRQNLSMVSDRVDNFSEATSNKVTMVQQNLSNVSERLENVAEAVQQLALSSNMSYQLLQENISSFILALGPNSPCSPVSSCAALPPSSPSGYYWVRASNGPAVRVYCDMTRSCGGIAGGWMRVAHLDMTNSSQQCPSGFNQRTDSNISSCVKTTCNCASIIAPVILNYTRVCGRVIGYQKGGPDAFRHVGNIDSAYVDGVSITHGSPRQHIWTLAAALDEIETDGVSYSCPCIRGNPGTTIPSFVGTDYFCDTGSDDNVQTEIFYSADPLWDGAGCGPLNTCCSFNTPPWFHRQLPQSTSDDIEIRVCTNDVVMNEDVAIQIIDLFVR